MPDRGPQRTIDRNRESDDLPVGLVERRKDFEGGTEQRTGGHQTGNEDGRLARLPPSPATSAQTPATSPKPTRPSRPPFRASPAHHTIKAAHTDPIAR